MAYSTKSVVNLWIVLVLYGLLFFYFKPCVAVPAAGLAAFTKTVKRYSKAADGLNSVLGAFSRSRSVAAISLLEQEKLEEAKESLAQTALILSVLDIGGGMALPVAEKIVEYIKTKKELRNTKAAYENLELIKQLEFSKPSGTDIDKNAIQTAKQFLKDKFKEDIENIQKIPALRKVSKVFAKASKWLKGASVFDVLGPLTDTLTIGLNIWGLHNAIKENNPEGIAAASLSIAAGVVGLTTFIAAIATGTAVLGPIGALAGAFLGIVATMVELSASPGYDTAAVDRYNEWLGTLGTLRDASKGRIDKRMEILERVGSQYSDVYVNNQAACVADTGGSSINLLMKDVQTNSQSSFYQRKFVGSEPLGISKAQAEIEDGQYVCIGDYNFLESPIKPLEPPFDGLGKEQGWVGFDFYGKFKDDTEYGGVHVFVDTDFISDLELKGVDIDTAKHSSSGTDSNTHQDDVISIGDYKKLKKKRNQEERKEILIKTSSGHDSLNINGMIGKFESSYENKLNADLGEGGDVLSFQGITKTRTDIKGVFFDSKTGIVKYYHGQNRNTHNTHTLGIVTKVDLFSGSPFDDHVILYSADFKVVQIGGRNVYEFNFNDLVAADLSESRQFQIVDQSTSSPKLNLKVTSPLEIKTNDVILQNRKLKVFDTTGQSPRPIFEVLLDTKSKGNLFINNAGSRPIDRENINPVLITGEKIYLNYGPNQRVDYEDGDKSDLLFLKWPTDQTAEKGTYEINMKGGTDYVVVSDNDFLDPSGVDGESLKLTVHRGFTSDEPNPDKPGTFKVYLVIRLEKSGDPANRFSAHLLNAEKIINEYGDELLDIEDFLGPGPLLSMDLYERYMEVTSETLNVKTEEDV